jgi:hypothetical protein
MQILSITAHELVKPQPDVGGWLTIKLRPQQGQSTQIRVRVADLSEAMQVYDSYTPVPGWMKFGFSYFGKG